MASDFIAILLRVSLYCNLARSRMASDVTTTFSATCLSSALVFFRSASKDASELSAFVSFWRRVCFFVLGIIALSLFSSRIVTPSSSLFLDF